MVSEHIKQNNNFWSIIIGEIDVFETQETIQQWSTMGDELPLEVQSISRR